MSQDQFRQVENQFFLLKGQLSAGRITQPQFLAALQKLMIQDAHGRYWMLGTESGKWYVHDGAAWIEAIPPSETARAPAPPAAPVERAYPTPPPQTAPPVYIVPVPAPAPTVAPARAKNGGCGGCGGCAIGCLVVAVFLVVGVVAGLLAIRNGAVKTADVLALVGIGPGYIEVNNFRDDKIQAQITPMDTTQDSPSSTRSLKFNAYDVNSYLAGNPGKYRVVFATANGANLGSCTLTIRSGDRYQFVALPARVIVNRSNAPSSVGADLALETSTFCR